MADKHRTGWYDGSLYARLLDPLTVTPFERLLKNMIDERTSVVDIGCGTGATVMALSGHCASAVGIDISPRMIAYAEKMRRKKAIDTVNFFLVERGTDLRKTLRSGFDYAIMKMMLHETDDSYRNDSIRQLRGIARHAVIVDYVCPLPKGFPCMLTNLIERTAGRRHFSNFRDWCRLGGLEGFLARQGLVPLEEAPCFGNVGKIVKVRLG